MLFTAADTYKDKGKTYLVCSNSCDKGKNTIAVFLSTADDGEEDDEGEDEVEENETPAKKVRLSWITSQWKMGSASAGKFWERKCSTKNIN